MIIVMLLMVGNGFYGKYSELRRYCCLKRTSLSLNIFVSVCVSFFNVTRCFSYPII